MNNVVPLTSQSTTRAPVVGVVDQLHTMSHKARFILMLLLNNGHPLTTNALTRDKAGVQLNGGTLINSRTPKPAGRSAMVTALNSLCARRWVSCDNSGTYPVYSIHPDILMQVHAEQDTLKALVHADGKTGQHKNLAELAQRGSENPQCSI